MSDSFVAEAKSLQPEWLKDFRAQQLQKFTENGLPTRKNELWKYTQIQQQDIPQAGGELNETCFSAEWTHESHISIVFVNGHFSEKLSHLEKLPREIVLCTLAQALREKTNRIKPYLLHEYDGKSFPFATLNSAKMTDGVFLDIPDNMICDLPIHFLFISTRQNDFISHLRNVVIAGKHSQVTIIEEYAAENAERYFTNTLTEMDVHEDARVTYYKVQNEALDALHVANIFVQQQKDSVVKTFSFAKGARLAREDLRISQQQTSAEVHTHGLYQLDHDAQHMDYHVHVDHLAAHGTSSMLYKGILDKKSRAVFNGKVHVHPKTKQINAHQANHNLLLSNDAEVNSKPELEIYAEDVKCTHGATIGQLDDEALFYLMSRGIEKTVAYKMLVRAFSEEVYDKVENENIRQYIHQRMNHHGE